MKYRIKRVKVVRYPVVRVTFEDGLSGEVDFAERIRSGPIFAPLKDQDFFHQVGVADGGYAFGWNLDDLGRELDFCADATRIDIETELVEKAAADYRSHRSAAE